MKIEEPTDPLDLACLRRNQLHFLSHGTIWVIDVRVDDGQRRGILVEREIGTDLPVSGDAFEGGEG